MCAVPAGMAYSLAMTGRHTCRRRRHRGRCWSPGRRPFSAAYLVARLAAQPRDRDGARRRLAGAAQGPAAPDGAGGFPCAPGHPPAVLKAIASNVDTVVRPPPSWRRRRSAAIKEFNLIRVDAGVRRLPTQSSVKRVVRSTAMIWANSKDPSHFAEHRGPARARSAMAATCSTSRATSAALPRRQGIDAISAPC